MTCKDFHDTQAKKKKKPHTHIYIYVCLYKYIQADIHTNIQTLQKTLRKISEVLSGVVI